MIDNLQYSIYYSHSFSLQKSLKLLRFLERCYKIPCFDLNFRALDFTWHLKCLKYEFEAKRLEFQLGKNDIKENFTSKRIFEIQNKYFRTNWSVKVAKNSQLDNDFKINFQTRFHLFLFRSVTTKFQTLAINKNQKTISVKLSNRILPFKRPKTMSQFQLEMELQNALRLDTSINFNSSRSSAFNSSTRRLTSNENDKVEALYLVNSLASACTHLPYLFVFLQQTQFVETLAE